MKPSLYTAYQQKTIHHTFSNSKDESRHLSRHPAHILKVCAVIEINNFCLASN